MDAFSYFPTIVYRDERPDLVQKVLSTCVQYLDQVHDQSVFRQSEYLGNHPMLQELVNYLLSSTIDLLKSQGYAVHRYDFYLSGLWAQEVNRGPGTNVHVHKNSQMCGWFFLETPQNGAYPIYHDTRMNKSMIELDFVQEKEITVATNTIHFNNMVPGTAMFSNSWMQHQLTGSNADSPTRCIHFIVSHKERSCNM